MDRGRDFFEQAFKRRGWLMVPPVIFTVFVQQHETEAHWVFFVGAIVFALGLWLRVWAQTHLHYRLKEPTSLTIGGPFAYVRNPIYLGNTLLLAGMCFLSELVWFVPLMLVWCALVYGIVVRYEESRLHGKFMSDYVQYRINVPRWWPRWTSWNPRAHSLPSRRLFWPSIVAEVHCVLLALPYVLKECF